MSLLLTSITVTVLCNKVDIPISAMCLSLTILVLHLSQLLNTTLFSLIQGFSMIQGFIHIDTGVYSH